MVAPLAATALLFIVSCGQEEETDPGAHSQPEQNRRADVFWKERLSQAPEQPAIRVSADQRERIAPLCHDLVGSNVTAIKVPDPICE